MLEALAFDGARLCTGSQLPRLLPPDRSVDLSSLTAHLARFGPMTLASPADLVDVVEAAGLTGRGGAAFPTARKLRAVAAEPEPAVIVANGSEGEPAAWKDKTLLALTPHLVLDGLQVAAQSVGATSLILYLHDDDRLLASMTRALADRQAASVDLHRVRIVTAPLAFIAGEESAAVSRIDGGRARPRVKPPRVTENGVGGRPTLVQNVETLAHLALIARFGTEWFRAIGTPDEPGSMLFTVSGAVRSSRVVEAPIGVPLRAVLDGVGGVTGPVQAVLFGGYHGAWLSWAEASEASLSNRDLRQPQTGLGAGVIVALPAASCGLAESSRVLNYLAAESVGQCGPCIHGLPLLADHFATLARPGRQGRARSHIENAAALLERRGACHHPDGSVRFARSALRVFATELEAHARGRCTATTTRPVLPTVTGDRAHSIGAW